MIDNISTKRETVMGSSRETTPTEKKPLSFSISRILGTDEDKKTSSAADVAVSRNAELPRVPMTIIHHINQGADDSYYTNFESQVQPRACSTPENAEYPSPPSYYHNMPYHVVHPHGPYLAHSDTNISQTPEHTDIPLKPTFKYVDNSYDKSLDSLGESYHHSPSPLKAKKKKTRTVFSRSQIYQLETAFDMKRYLSSAERSGLASQLNLSETQIKIWFQNRRNKWKRQINGEMDEIPISSAFATGLLSPPFCQPSLNSLSHVRDPREELLRGSMSVPSYYSHPYMQETRMRPTYLH